MNEMSNVQRKGYKINKIQYNILLRTHG